MFTKRFWSVVQGVVGMIFLVLVIRFGLAKDDAGPQQTMNASIPAELLQPEWDPIGWPEVDRIMKHRLQIIGLLDLAQAPGVAEWTNEYYLTLARRKEHVIAFAMRTNPEVKVIGVIHDPPHGHGDAELYQRIDAAQIQALAELKASVSADSIIMVEAMKDCAEPLTFESANGLIADYKARYAASGMLLKADTERAFSADRPKNDIFGEAIIMTPPQAYCAEEWPQSVGMDMMIRKEQITAAATRLPAAGSESDSENLLLTREDLYRYKLAKTLYPDFAEVRSEVALIRALEILERTGAGKAIILMGGHHGLDLEQVKDSYHIRLTTWYPEGYRESVGAGE